MSSMISYMPDTETRDGGKIFLERRVFALESGVGQLAIIGAMQPEHQGPIALLGSVVSPLLQRLKS